MKKFFLIIYGLFLKKYKKSIFKWNILYIFENAQFAIIQKKCTKCGLFSFYMYFLGCLNKYLNKGYIPVIDLKSYPNAYNNYSNTSIINPWEFLFEQPFGFTLEDTLRNAKKIKIFECGEHLKRPDERKIYYNKKLKFYSFMTNR